MRARAIWSRTPRCGLPVAVVVVLRALWLAVEPSSASRSQPTADHARFVEFGAPVVLRSGPDAGYPVFALEYQPQQAPRTVTGAKFVVSWDEGFAANAAARQAFEAALDTWARELFSPVPIVINAPMEPLGSDELAAARPLRAWRGVGGTDRDTWLVDALADAAAGRDLCATLCPGEPDIDIVFNDMADLWYLGLDGNVPVGRYDFRTTALHEVAHGLGFLGSLSVTDDVCAFVGATLDL